MKKLRWRAVAAAVSLALAAGSAHAVLERVGPVGFAPSQGGFPVWYQDKSGLTLEFCDPRNQAELDGGWCLLLPGDAPAVPEVFPSLFFDEHFYFAADANMTTRGGSRAALVMAVEAAFVSNVAPGGQITFSRIRVRLDNVPVTGTYRFIHPYGEEIIPAVAGERIFFTDDVGFTCPPGTFDCALGSRLGPFLLPSATPGGAELPPVTGPVPGKLYIADPGRVAPVTGSPLPDFTDSTGTLRNHNVFRIEGPPGSGLGVDPNTGAPVDWIETTNFALMGRLFGESIPGRVDVHRANYARTGAGTQLDVFATADATMQPRMPGQPPLAGVAPQLSVYGAPCTGTVDAQGNILPPFTPPATGTEKQMISQGSKHWAQLHPTAVPTHVCVKDNTARNADGQIAPTYALHKVTDAVTVNDAYFDPLAGTLTVTASSSEQVAPPTLALSFNDFRNDMLNGQIQVTQLTAPPSKVQVFSSAGGMGEFPVRVGAAPDTAPPQDLVAVNDLFAIDEDTVAPGLNVLGNDTGVTGAVVTITQGGRLGTASVNPDGSIRYTPIANVNGTDAFTYTATVDGRVSNTATVTVTINPVNDRPQAAGESANAIVNVPVQIDVAANDFDLDGNADIVSVGSLTQPVGNAGQAGATAVANGRIVTFNALSEGTYTFTYRPIDRAGATSDTEATVTVTVIAAEAVNVTRADYTRNKGRLRVDGNISPASNQFITVTFTDDAGVQKGDVIATPRSDALGAWTVDTVVALPAGATRVKATSQNGTSQSRALTLR